MGIMMAILSSIAWGSADFGGGTVSRRISPYLSVLYSQGVSLVGIVVITAVAGGFTWSSRLFWSIGAGFIGPLALVGYYRALALGPMGVVGPISATSGLVPVVVGIALGDRVLPGQFVGIALAIVGVGLISTHKSEGVHRVSFEAVALALGSAIGFGLVFVGLNRAAPAGILPSLAVQRSVNVVIIAALVVARRTSARVSRGDLGRLAVVGFLDVSANGLFSYASHFGSLAILGALGSTYPISTTIAARYFHSERLRPVQILGAAVTLIGIVLATGL
jgi:drug/metabolite transporter (DMT)-like permease